MSKYNRYHNAINACMDIIEARKIIRDAKDIIKKNVFISELNNEWSNRELAEHCFVQDIFKGNRARIESKKYVKTQFVFRNNKISLHEKDLDNAKRKVLYYLLKEVGQL